jgi:hypothetical protein
VFIDPLDRFSLVQEISHENCVEGLGQRRTKESGNSIEFATDIEALHECLCVMIRAGILLTCNLFLFL